MTSETTESSGVQQLIDRLHKEGVDKGQSEAGDLVASARQEATQLLDKAKRDAEAIIAAAKVEAEQTRTGAEAAIQAAGRDVILGLTESLREDFVNKLHKLVGHTLRDTEFLKELISEIARHSVPSQGTQVNVQVLKDSSDLAFNDETLNELTRSLGGEALRDGLTFEVADSAVPGVRIQAIDDDLEIDLTNETLTHLLLQRLSPRFRDILEQP